MAKQYAPHPYQERALKLAQDNPAYYWALKMGSGKTVAALTYADWLVNHEFIADKVLVVAPLKTAETGWAAEEWMHLQKLKVVKVLGDLKSRTNALLTQADVYVINRDNFVWLVKHFGKAWPFSAVVWDESSGLKDQGSKRWKAFKAVRKYIDRVLFLSGTPRPNGVEDLWPQMYLIEPSLLGRTITEFRSEYMVPDKRNQQRIFSWKPKAGAEERINDVLSPYMMSLADNEYPYKPDPEPIQVLVDIPMGVYEELRSELVVHFNSGTLVAQMAATLTGKLRQITSGRVYDEDRGVIRIHDEKMDALAEILEKADGPVLVFYEYQHTRDEMVRRFGVSTELDIPAWNAGKVPVLALHPASCGHGVDGLQQAGSICVWVDLPWSLELWEQANARLDRQGQKNAVRIYTIVAKNTIDLQVIAALQRKEIGQSAMLAAIVA